MTPRDGDDGLIRTISVGSVRIHAIEAGTQRLDGGAMFGVVPRPLWEKRIAPDDRHRIPLALRCLLIEASDALVLVDTGIGNKESEKFRDIFGVSNEGEPGPTKLEDGIRAAGFEPGDVDIVLSTHLHFDHAGGNTVLGPDGAPVPAFPAARYIVQRCEFDFARLDNERIRAAYPRANIDPVAEAGLWEFVEGESEIAAGVSVLPTPGHTPHHQSVLIEDGGETACFLADVCPTTAHLPLSWTMGYDVEPLVTMESKRKLWDRAEAEGWLLVFEHDPVVAWGRLDRSGRRVELVPPANDRTGT